MAIKCKSKIAFFHFFSLFFAIITIQAEITKRNEVAQTRTLIGIDYDL
jgi:hypothetical protein